MWVHPGKEIEYLVKQYQQFFGRNYTVDYSDPMLVATGTYKAGHHVDKWGCIWDNVDEGMEADRYRSSGKEDQGCIFS